jgi:hypothetical protein
LQALSAPGSAAENDAVARAPAAAKEPGAAVRV